MEEHKVNISETDGGKNIIIWHPHRPQGIGVGLMFEKGGRLQLYCHTGVYTDRRIVTSNTGMATFQELQLELIDYARKHYPKEFAEIKNPRP